MKLIVGFVAALAGCAAAAQQAADVYIIPSLKSTPTPSVSRSLARLILLQRLAPAGTGPAFRDAPEGSDAEDVVALMNQFGKPPRPLFAEGETGSPSQLVLMLEGMTPDQIKQMETVLATPPTFTISDPPSANAHEKLVKNDFYNAGVTNTQKCSFKKIINPLEKQCWSAKSAVAKYNVQNDPKILDEFSRNIGRLAGLAISGEMETTIVLLPHDKASTGSKSWSDRPQELRRRQAGDFVSDADDAAEAPVSPASHPVFYASRAPIPACFTSEELCNTTTQFCSGNGKCGNKYANPDGSEGKEVCYVCRCLSTASGTGTVTHWAGATCSKQDVSLPFWLFAGFTLAMVGILSLAIGMMFSVGEEKLPGVIGAGVSRTK